MKIQVLLILFLSFTVINCQEKNKEYHTNKIEKKSKMIDTLVSLNISDMKQLLEEEYENIDGDIPSSEKTINWLNSEVLKFLLKNGYKTPTQSDIDWFVIPPNYEPENTEYNLKVMKTDTQSTTRN